MARKYTDLLSIEYDVKNGVLRDGGELRQAFIKALKEEFLESVCNKYIVTRMLIPALNDALKLKDRSDIRISNLIIKIEAPNVDLSKSREQLFNHMKELYQQLRGKTVIYGLLTNGVEAELHEYCGEPPKLQLKDSMAKVVRRTLEVFCTQKIPVTDAKDLVRLFGI